MRVNLEIERIEFGNGLKKERNEERINNDS